MARKSTFALILAALLSASAFAGNGVPMFLPFQGRATDNAGQPINSTATFKFRIYPPAGTCYLYEDTQTITPNGYGFFSVIIGTLANRTGPANSLQTVFSNEAAMTDSCAATYTPSSADWRRLEVVVDGVALPTMQTIAASAFSMNSQMLDGKTSSGYIQVAGSVSQANVTTLTNGSDASALHNHDSIYAKLSGNNTLSGNLTTTGSFYASGAASTVGIGTTTAAADIDIRKTSPSILLGATSGGGGTPTITFTSGATQRAQIRSSETTNELRFYTGSTQAMVLDANQNLILTGSLQVGGTTSLGKYTTAQETTLVSGLGAANVGTMWVNSQTGTFKFWDGTQAVSLGSSSYVSSVTAGTGLSNSGTATAPILNVSYGSAAGTAIQGNATFGGDVTGGYTALTVGKLQGRSVVSTAPASGEVLTWNGSAWAPATVADSSLSSNVALKNAANTFTAANLIQVPTLTTTALTLQTTDNNTTNPLLSFKNSTGTAVATVRADGVTTASTDLATKSYVDTQDGNKLSLSGGTMSGAINMGGNGITNMTDPSSAQDAATKNYADTHLASRAVSTAAPSSGQVMGWNGSGWAPVAVNAVQIQGRDVANTAPTANQILKWNGSMWVPSPDSDAGGDITSITAGTGLLGGGIFGDVTLSVNVGTGANQILQLNSSSQIPAVDGSLLTGVNASKIGTRTVTSAAPTSGYVLAWNGSQWEPTFVAGGDITDVNVGTGLTGGGTVGSVTVSLANTSVSASSYGSATQVASFTVDAQGRLTAASNTAIALPTTALTVTGAAANQVLKWNGSFWLPSTDLGITALTGDVTASGTGSVAATIANDAITTAKIQSSGIGVNRLMITDGTTGNSVTFANSCAVGEVLKWQGAGSGWACSTDVGAGGIVTSVATGTGLTGGPITSAGTISLANTAVSAGSYGSASSVPSYTVDAQGRLTAASNTPIAIASTAITQTGATANQVLTWNGSAWLPATPLPGDITDVNAGTGLTGGGTSGNVTLNLANTSVSAASYGSASQVASFTVDAQGRLTAAANTSIAIPSTAITQTGAASNDVLRWNGSAWLPAAITSLSVSYIGTTSDLTGGPITATGTLGVNTGTGANQILKLNSSSQIPAVDGSLLTNVNASKIGTRTVSSASPTSGYALAWNGSQWEPTFIAGGDITDVQTGTGLTGGFSNGAGTISLANTAVSAASYGSATQVASLTVDAQGRLTAASNTAIALPTTALTVTGAAANQVLKWNGSFWLPSTDLGITALTGDVTASGTGSVAATIANDAITTAKIQSSGIGVNRILITDGTTGNSVTFANSCAVGEVLKWQGAGSGWACSSDVGAGGIVTSVATGTGLTGGPITSAGTISLANTSVSAASYGSASQVPTYTVDAQGRLTAASNTPIAIASTAITQTGATANQVLTWNGSAWLPATPLPGDITDVNAGTGLTGGGTSGNVTLNLANTSVSAASYGSATQVPTYTVDAQGRLTAASNTAIALPPTQITQGGATANQVLTWNGSFWLPAAANAGDITDVQTGTGLSGGFSAGAGTISLANTSVSAASYGSATQVPTYTVDAQGRLTAASNTPIAIATTALTQTGAAANQVLTWNGSAWLPAAASVGDITDVQTGTGLTGGFSAGAGTISLANTSVSAASYGSATQVASFTVDAQGRLTAASNTAIALPTTALTVTGATANQVLKWNGSFWLPGTDLGITALTGDVTASGTGSVAATIANDAITTAKISSSGIGVNRILITDGTTGNTVTLANSCAVGEVLKWQGAGSGWACSSDVGAGGIVTSVATGTGLTGGPITSAGTISLANTSVSAASYGSATQVPTYTVDAQGRLTAASNTAIALPPTQITQGGATANQVLTWNGSFWLPAAANAGDITDVQTGTGLSGGFSSGAGTISLANTSVSAASYGSATQVASFTVDAQGRLTAASNTAIALPTTALTVTGATANQVLTWNGSYWLPANAAATGVTTVASGTGLTGGPITANGTLSLANTSVSAASYGSATQVASFTVDAQGRLTAASNTAIALPTTALTVTGATANQVLTWNGSFWLPAAASSGDITDVQTGTGLSGGFSSGAGTISLANTSVSAASYGSATQVPTYTVDAQGRLTAASNTAIALPPTQITQGGATANQVLKWNGSFWLPAADAGGVATIAAGTGLNGGTITNAGTISLADTAVSPAAYGSATQVATFTVDQQGRLTAAGNTAIALPTTALTVTGATANQILKWNGSFWLPSVPDASSIGGQPVSTAAPGSGTILRFNGTGWVATTAAYPATAGTSGTLLQSDGTNFVNTTATYPATGGTSSTILRSNGTNFVNSTSTFADTYSANVLLYASAGNTVTGLTSANNAILATNGSGVPAWDTTVTLTGNRVGISTSSPTAGAVLDINGTGVISSVIVPRGTTAERSVTSVAGMIRYNTTTAKFEGYENGNWTNLAVTGSTALFGDGSVGSPSISFLNDTDTGFYTPSTNSNIITAATGGTERLRVSASGAVGINSASPTVGAILDVNGLGTSGSAMVVPRDTTANRPTGTNGMIRYNTTISRFEVFANGVWANMRDALFIQSTPVSNTAPADGDMLKYNASLGVWNPTQAVGSMLMTNLSNATVAASTTSYTMANDTSFNGTESRRNWIVPMNCTVKNFYVRTGAAQSGTGSFVWTIRKNGVATAITFTIPAGSAAGTFSDTTNEVYFDAGDLLSIQAVNNATVASATVQSLSIQLLPR